MEFKFNFFHIFFSIFSPTFFNFFNFFLHCLSLFPNFFHFFFQVLFSFFPVFFSTLILCQVMLSNHRFSNKEKENFVVLLVVDSKDIEKSRKIVECCKVQTNYYTSFLLLWLLIWTLLLRKKSPISAFEKEINDKLSRM